MMSATLRFPFQASLDGYSMVETDGNLYYGLDISLEPAELPAQVYSHLNSESDTHSGLGLDSNDDEDEDKQQQQESKSQVVFHPPRWDSLVKSQEQEQEQEQEQAPDVAPRPVSVSMHPHRINTSDQQRFATDHEMAAAEEVEEENMICESPSSSTLDETEAEEESTIRVSVPSSSVQQFIPSRYYATPLIEDDLTSTPVAIYGLEKPSGHVSKKKAPAVLKQRGSSAAAQARPSSRHQQQPSPLSWTDNRAEEQARASTSSTRRLSMFLGRAPTPTTAPASGVSRPTIGSISSSGSSATTATMRSAVSAVSDVSTASSISASSSPTIIDSNRKPDSPSTTPDLAQTSSSTRPPQPLRRTTAPIPTLTNDHTPIIRGDTRRSSIFNFSMPKFSSPMMHHRAGIQSSENLTTIRAVRDDDQVTITSSTANSYPFHDPTPETSSSSSSSKQMPFSPDSFVSPHTQPTPESYTTTNNPPSDIKAYNNTTSFSQINRPHTSHHDQRPPPPITPQYQPYRRNEQQPQSQLRKPKKSDHHHQHRATKLLTRIFVTDLNQKA